MPDIPTLETDRLILRPHRLEDWPDYAALMCSDRAAFMGGPGAYAENIHRLRGAG